MDKVKIFHILCIYILFIGGQTLHGDIEIIAHRGASDAAPENTIAAFNQAWKENSDAAECDVHLTKDNKVVVIHDASTKFTTGVDLKVRDANSDEIRKLDAGKLKHPQFTGEKIPFLEEVIETVPPGKSLFIEIKCGQEVLPYLKDIIEKSGKKQQLTIIGFDLPTITAAKKIMPEIPVYWLVGRKKDEATGKILPYDPNLIETTKKTGIDGLDAHSPGMTRQFVEKANAAGQKLYVWTVDDVNEVKYLHGIGVSGITTNKPGMVRSVVYSKIKTSPAKLVNDHNVAPDLTFVQATDPQMTFCSTSPALWQTTIDKINILKPAFLIVTGDIINGSGSESQTSTYFSMASNLLPTITRYDVPGNHDVGNTPNSNTYSWYLSHFGPVGKTTPWYSFNYGESLFIVLESDVLKDPSGYPGKNTEQINWLTSTLASGSSYAHKFVFMHHPLCITSITEPNQYFNMPTSVRQQLLGIFHQYGVNAVFSGHYHKNAYVRDGNLELITTSSCTCPLGSDPPGVRVINIYPNRIEHQYKSLDSIVP